MVERLFLAVPRGCLQFVIVVFPDHTHLLFLVGILENHHILQCILMKVNSEPSLCYVRYLFKCNPAKWTSKYIIY